MFIEICVVCIGFFLLIKGADFLVDGASNLAKQFHIPEIVIGLTIVAVGTSMPELMVSTTSAINGYSDIAIGNVVGSNIANLFFILGVCAIINPLKFKKQTKWIENPVTLIATASLLIVGNDANETIITKQEGIILLICALIFVAYNVIMAKRGNKLVLETDGIVEIENTNQRPILKTIIMIAVGIASLKYGGDFVVNGSENIAIMLGISEKLISLTIIAFSTSLPELITSVIASMRGQTDMAIGNILGSQIFNIFLIIGVAALLTPINYSLSYNIDMIVLLLGTVILGIFPFVGKKNYMTRLDGILFLIIYFSYMSYIVLTNI